MIVNQLACAKGHFFEGWFASSEECDRQAARGLLACPECSSTTVRKLPCAPYVKGSSEAKAARAQADASRLQRAKNDLRSAILASTDDVGRKFVEIARRIHYREEEARNIRGEATLEEAMALEEEGIEAYAIPPDVLPPGPIH